MQARKSFRLLGALCAFSLLLFCGFLNAQAQDQDFVKYEDLPDDYRSILESAPEVTHKSEGNDPPTPYAEGEENPVAEMMSWKLEPASQFQGNWVLKKLELTDEVVPAGVKAKSKEEVLRDIQGDFPIGATGFALDAGDKLSLKFGDKVFLGTAGVYQQQFVLEGTSTECTTCGNRFALRILSQSPDKVTLGLPMQDEDEPYLINLHFAKSTN